MTGISHMIIAITLILLIVLPLGLFMLDKVLLELEVSEAYQTCDFALQTVISLLSAGSLSRGDVQISDSILEDHIVAYLSSNEVDGLKHVEAKFYDLSQLPVTVSGQAYDVPSIIFKAVLTVQPHFFKESIERTTGRRTFDIPIHIVKEVSTIQ